MARLGGLVRRKNNKLRAINGRPETDSVPGHQLHSTLLQIPLTEVYRKRTVLAALIWRGQQIILDAGRP